MRPPDPQIGHHMKIPAHLLARVLISGDGLKNKFDGFAVGTAFFAKNYFRSEANCQALLCFSSSGSYSSSVVDHCVSLFEQTVL